MPAALPSVSVAIVGAGWYGCHIGLSLAALGFGVTVFDAAARPLDAASGNNQSRLHLGFHYPRHYETRMQSRDGFVRFMERYPHLTRPVSENIYAVATNTSLLDFRTYKLIMASSGIDFQEREQMPRFLTNVEAALYTKERVLLIERARRYFAERLGAALVLGCKVAALRPVADGVEVNGRRFDYAIDATWGHLCPLPVPVTYEPTILLYYEGDPAFGALTLVDGPGCAIYPTEQPGVFTLSSVRHTPLGRFATAAEARLCRDRLDGATVAARTAAMEQEISAYVPDYRDRFRFLAPQRAIKTKPLGSYDDRSCQVFRDGRCFHVLSGKIDTVFFAVERILSVLEAEAAPA